MYDQFTERARQVVVLAEQAARDLGHHHVDTEHVLLGLIAEHDGLAARTLEAVGIDRDRTYAIITQLAPSTEGPVIGHIAFSARSKSVMELAHVESEHRQLHFVGTEHVLLGLLDQIATEPDGGLALRVLNELSVTPGQIREKFEQYVPVADGGLSWMLRRGHGLESRGVPGAGWNVVLSLEPAVHLRRLLIRAAGVAMDDGRSEIESPDLLAALSRLPEAAGLLRKAGVTPAPPVPGRQATSQERDWTRIDASEQVIAVLIGAERVAVDNRQQTVTIQDLLITLATEQPTLLGSHGWDITALESLRIRPNDQAHPKP